MAEEHTLLEPLPGVAPAEKGSIRTNKRGLFEALDFQGCFPLSPEFGRTQDGDACFAKQHQRLSFQEPACQRGSRQCGPSGYSSPGPNPSPSSLIGLYVQLEHRITIWTGPQASGRTKSWFLSPSIKAFPKTSPRQPSPHE